MIEEALMLYLSLSEDLDRQKVFEGGLIAEAEKRALDAVRGVTPR